MQYEIIVDYTDHNRLTRLRPLSIVLGLVWSDGLIVDNKIQLRKKKQI